MPIILFLISVGESRPKAALNATIDYIVVTDETALHEITAIVTVTIVNKGQAQSIASGLSLRTVIDGQTYIGVPTAMPEKLSVNIEKVPLLFTGLMLCQQG